MSRVFRRKKSVGVLELFCRYIHLINIMENLQTSFKKLNWKTNGKLFGFGTSPEADWKIIFISTVALALLVIIISAFIFIKIDKGEKTLDISLLKKTVSYYQGKAVEFERIKRASTPAVDPSL